MECLKVISEKIVEFIEWNGTGNIIPILALATTWIIYHRNKVNQRKNAARIVVMQIESIYDNVVELSNCIREDYSYDPYKMNQSKSILDENEWNNYKHLFIKKLSDEQIKTINLYYEYAILFNEQQNALKHSIKLSYDAFYSKYVENDKNYMSKKRVYIRTSEIYTQTIRENIKSFKNIKEIFPLEKLKKIAGMK